MILERPARPAVARLALACAAACAVAGMLVSFGGPARAGDAIADAVGDARVVGADVVVADHGRVVYDRAFGVRDKTTTAPVDEHTRFEIGSTTKQFTAAAIMQLIEQGKVKLSDSLAKYVPQYRPGRRVTVQQLLWQVSGIPEFTALPAFGDALALRNGRLEFVKPVGFPEMLAMLGQRPLDFAPGSRWEYSNTNYAFLGAIVAAASGLTWQQYVRTHLFAPAGMRESAFVTEEANVDDMATGYGSVPGKAGLVPTGAQLNVPGPGGIVTTARDLARWNDALFGGRIVSPHSLALMTTASAPSRRAHREYGFGLELQSFDGVRRVEHGGRTFGFMAMNDVYPTLRQQVIVLANSSFADVRSIADEAFDARNPRLGASTHTEDPSVTALVKRLWDGMASGHMDQSLLSPQMGRFMASPRAGTSRFASYGPVTAWMYRKRRDSRFGPVYRYKLVFADGRALLLDVGVTPEHKVASIGFFTT